MANGDDRALGAAVADHLRAAGLPADSGVSLRWVKVRWLGVPLAFPNFDARRAILVTHDVHHLLTGYPTTWRGEAAIGGFELASGCKHYWAAWLFHGGGFLFGLFLCPAHTFRGFVRGRHGRNFYGVAEAELLRRTVGAARAELGLDRPVPRATRRDVFAFARCTALVLLLYAAPPLGALAWLLLA